MCIRDRYSYTSVVSGSHMQWCPPSPLSTVVLGKRSIVIGGSESTWKYGATDASVRLSEAGQLAGNHLDVIGFSNLPPAQKSRSGNETELDVDFCITWSNDPR